MLVREIMTPKPITIKPESDSLAAIAIMRSGRFKRLPVVTPEGELVGIVSFVDCVAVHPEDIARQQAFTSDGVVTRVKDVMSSPVISVAPDYPLEEAAQLMVDHHIGCLPVVEDDVLVGIVTDTDVFRTLVAVLGGGSPAVRVTAQVDNTPGQFARLARRVADVNGNIISIASHPADDPARFNITMRVEGILLDALLDAVSDHPGIEILHTWDQLPED